LATIPCNRPGCGGVIEDGYCTECGLAPLAAAPEAASAPLARTGSTPSVRTGRSSRSVSATSSSRGALGSGRVPLPPLPPQDPLAALIPGEVPERKRYCSNCGLKLTREAGFCRQCGQEYSFRPSLQPGDVVAGKYEIKGTIAFGGLGWIYLALDTVLSRWVVLKGLLNAKDPNMVALAVKEREFLAAVKHPSIVGIYDFINQGREGYIVMEYVNGKTLMTLRKEHGGPLPVLEAASYILHVLPAFAYLDEHGLVYCDFKPDNAMLEGEEVKLIDMGAVRRVDDLSGDVFGSKGYAAPEAGEAPSPVSDLYSVARALAVLVADFDFQGRFEHTLPPPEAAPAFRQSESLYRLLRKATRADPSDRFQIAREFADQLLGVVREAALDTLDLGHVESTFFVNGDSAGGSGRLGRSGSGRLPDLRVDPADPAASVVEAASALTEPRGRRALLERALGDAPGSEEIQLRLAGALVDLGAFPEAEQRLAQVKDGGSNGWRHDWLLGRLLLAEGKATESLAVLESVLDELPGELAPKLALADAYAAAGNLDRAISYYDLVSRADPSLTGAAFGLARCLEARGDRDGAVAAYERVPATSSRRADALYGLARALSAGRPGAAELARASAAVEELQTLQDGLDLHELAGQLLRAAAEGIEAGTLKPAPDQRLLGLPLEARPLRRAAERELRTCAHFATLPADKIRFVDEANRVRPITLI
jgi:serine/threonine-protein kinase PknG